MNIRSDRYIHPARSGAISILRQKLSQKEHFSQSLTCHLRAKTAWEVEAAVDKNYYNNARGMNRQAVNNGVGCAFCGNRNARQSSGCSCQNGGDSLMRKIQEIDFAIYETVLYLDVYPCSSEALAYYHTLLCEKEALSREYESKIGPISAFGNTDKSTWNWVKKPWPWEYSAN